ncbi:hypothetical protein GJ699_30320 [Duganella sp. FT80W]|uniref:Uncharacterized protein n=1 Tax=Duganella guangzhouensis TaxID=2666084 RepID=A0A6I2LDH2_9BURK|nr:hypothetical protein [Duganella guangzhouensis]MRW94279.1 hypothetical protein [Duganella guangzhouensis]
MRTIIGQLHMKWIRDLDSLYDFLGYVVLRAPDHFPKEDYLRPEEQMTLQKAFYELRTGLDFVEGDFVGKPVKDRLYVLLDESQAAYAAGERHKGAHLLQDLQALVFKK